MSGENLQTADRPQLEFADNSILVQRSSRRAFALQVGPDSSGFKGNTTMQAGVSDQFWRLGQVLSQRADAVAVRI
jgi:hypothetical protein